MGQTRSTSVVLSYGRCAFYGAPKLALNINDSSMTVGLSLRGPLPTISFVQNRRISPLRENLPLARLV